MTKHSDENAVHHRESGPLRIVADTVLAVTLLAALAAVGVWLWLAIGLAGWAASGTPRYDTAVAEAVSDTLVVVGVCMAVCTAVAVLCLRRRLWVTGVSQALAAVAAGLFLLGSVVDATWERKPGPEVADHDGPGRACRSGGDSHECPGG